MTAFGLVLCPRRFSFAVLETVQIYCKIVLTKSLIKLSYYGIIIILKKKALQPFDIKAIVC